MSIEEAAQDLALSEQVRRLKAAESEVPPQLPQRRGISAQEVEDNEVVNQDEMREFFTDVAPEIGQSLTNAEFRKERDELGRDIDAAVQKQNELLRKRTGGRSATIAMNKLKKGLIPKARPNKLIKEVLAMVGGPEEMKLLGGMKGRERLGTLRKKYTGENPEIRLLLS